MLGLRQIQNFKTGPTNNWTSADLKLVKRIGTASGDLIRFAVTGHDHREWCKGI
jgi:hypothetical protein